jgi:hypothetical protein
MAHPLKFHPSALELALKNLGAVILLLLFVFSVVNYAQSQAKKRTAILRGGNQFPQAEQTIADQVSTLLVEDNRVEVVDRDRLAQIINEQNLQHYFTQPYDPQKPRFSSDSMVQLGKLLGVPAIVFVRVDTWYGGPHTPVTNGKKHTVSGNVVLKATAQIVNVETGAIVASPTASFNQERVLSEGTDGRLPKSYGPIAIPGEKGTQGPDPQIAMGKLTSDAFEFVEHELAGKIANAIAAAPLQRPVPVKIPKVAGVQNGMTFLNAGTTAGLKVGDIFQIVRMADSGMQDPDTHQPIFRKKLVCLLTISEIEDSLASGKCAGDPTLPGDQAIAQGH